MSFWSPARRALRAVFGVPRERALGGLFGRQPTRWVGPVLAALLMAGWVAASGAQEPQRLRFENLGFEQGLSQGFITAIAQDSQGFVWFGTQEGLNRFDGYTLRTFLHDPEEPESLSHDLVRALLVDSRGGLWVGTEAGLDLWDPVGERFQSVVLGTQAGATTATEGSVRALAEVAPGRLWAGTDGQGLFEVDLSRTPRAVPLKMDGASEALAIRAVVRDSDDRIWVATDGQGLWALNTEGKYLDVGTVSDREFRQLTKRIRSLAVGADDLLLIGTYERGLVALDVSAGWTVDERSRAVADAANTVRSIHPAADGEIWLGTDMGLIRLGADGRVDHWQHRSSSRHSLAGNRVNVVFEDRGGVLWFGTNAGVSRWSRLAIDFRHYRSSEDGRGLAADYVTGFAETGDGRVWVGTFGAGIDLFDPATDSFENLRHDPRDAGSLSGDRVSALLVDSAEGLWVGTVEQGLNHRPAGRSDFERYRHDPAVAATLAADGVTCLSEDAQGAIWVGSFGKGVTRLEPRTGRLQRFGTEDGLESLRVLDILEDRAGDLWFATLGGGLHRFDRDDQRFHAIRHDDGDRTSLSSDQVWAVHEDGRGDLWIATRNSGVNHWLAADRAADEPRFQRYTEASGLPSGQVYGVLHDDASDLWLSSNQGLIRLDPDSGRMSYYDETHGLQSLEFNSAAHLRARDGRLFFGGVNGFNVFRPAVERQVSTTPNLMLTRLEVNGVEMAVGDWSGGIELEYDQANLAVEVSALDFSAPGSTRYGHWLEGLDESWIEDGRRRITYTNLDPGHYTLRMRASHDDLLWQPTADLEIPLHVRPPLWRTTAAYAAYLVSALVALIVLWRSRRRKLLAARALQEANDRLLAEIEEREAQERRVDAERRRAQSYFEGAEVALVALDRFGQVVQANPRAQQLFGLEDGALTGAELAEHFVADGQRERFVARIEEALRDGRSALESLLVRPDGSERIVSWQVASLAAHERNADRSVVLLSGVDLTTTRSLVEARERAESASRAKSRFLANMSHEIRTPIGGVLGLLELLADSELSAAQRRQVITARQAARGLLDLVNNVLDFSKIEAGHVELERTGFDLRELIDDLVGLLRAAAERKGLRLERDVADEVPTLLVGDPTRLRQVLSNLIGNAIKFTEKGSVGVRVLPGDVDGRLRFEVYDTGIGLPEGTREELFEAFHQADESTTRRFGGTGLGLSISRQLVELMGGAIQVESELGVGSRFFFQVPLEEDRSQEWPALEEPPEVRAGQVVLVSAEGGEALSSVVGGLGLSLEVVAPSELELSLREMTAPLAILLPRESVDALASGDQELLQELRGRVGTRVLLLSEVFETGDLSSDRYDDILLQPVHRSALVRGLFPKARSRSRPADQRLTTAPSREGLTGLDGLRVLIVEDNEAIQQVAVGMVEACGAEATVECDGEGAVRGAQSGDFDLILMDCQLPAMDGFEATRRIRRDEQERSQRRVPIVAMTANAMAGDRERCLEAGMDDYVSKPFTLEHLTAAIGRVLSYPVAEVSSPSRTDRSAIGSRAVDPTVLASLFDSSEAETNEILVQFVRSFLASSERHLGDLGQAVSARDFERIRMTAHTLKGSSSMVGAERFSQLCERLGSAAGNEEEVRTVEALLIEEWTVVRRELESFCRESRSAPGEGATRFE